jgi:glycosyltransferase involved in cell wall biosynthesis
MVSTTPDSRLRVLHVGKFYAPEKGGMETHLTDLAEYLGESLDVEVLVANRFRWSETQNVKGIPVHRAGSWLTFARTPICPAMLKDLRHHDADIVHLHWPNPWAVLSYLASGHSGKLVISYHSDVVRQRFLGAAFEPLLHRALDRSAAIIVSSSRYLQSSPVLKQWAHRCHIIPYGLDTSHFFIKRPEERDEIHRRFGPRIVLGVGRMVYYKGFEYLIRAMRHVDATLLLIGTGPQESQLAREAAKLPSSARVRFLGNIDDLAPFYQAATLFVLPSIARSEAFGLVQLEAMAAGTPVINTSLDSGVPTVSLHNVTGLTVPPADEFALARAMTRLLDDEALRLRFGHAARCRVQQEFSPSRMTKAVLDIYAEVSSRSATQLTAVAC